MNAEIAAGAFWLVDGFWQAVGGLAAFAAAAAFVIVAGPGEIPYDEPAGEEEL